MSAGLLFAVGLISLTLVMLAAALLFGGPSPAPAMASINDPFKGSGWSNMPPLSRYPARDGTQLAYRHYGAEGNTKNNKVKGSVVLVHGSSASSQSMHKMADLEDFIKSVAPAKPATLVGFSSGGGFVLRVAGSARQTLFESYLLLSPYLGPTAANYRPNSGGWVRVGLPRLIALSILNGFHISALNHLTVLNFALNDEAKSLLTPSYSFNLASNFQPERDYQQNLRNVQRPCAVIAGANDEAFQTDQLEPELRRLGISWPVTLLPGIGHIPLTLEQDALATAVQAVEKLAQ